MLHPCWLVVVLALLLRASSLHGREKDMELRFNLTHAKAGKEAVKEAINFMLDQQDQLKSTNLRGTELSSGGGGTCRVTINAMQNEGMFEYIGQVPPPYDDCWARRIRYHMAPICEQQEQEREPKTPELHHWRWTLRSASKGLCHMPKPSIIAAASSYLRNQASSPAGLRTSSSLFRDVPGTAVNILMLGLSFMGQPFQSLICLNNHYLQPHHSYGRDASYKHRISVADILPHHGHCTGYESNNIATYFPPHLHPQVSLPQQNMPSCNLENGLMVFREGNLTVRVCYTYTFNMELNIKPDSQLPCELQWNDIDVVFALHHSDELIRYYLPRTNAPVDQLRHVHIVTVDRIYQGMLTRQLNNAYSKLGYQERQLHHLQAQPLDCENPDIHYRLPGITDHTIQMWLSLMANGLHYSEHKTIGAVKFYGND